MFKQNFQAVLILIFLISFSPSLKAEPISFSMERGVPEVEIVINGKIKASFIIDTGADQVYIDQEFAEKNGLLSGNKMALRPVAGIDDDVEAFQIFLNSLEVGEIKKNVVGAVTIDLSVVVQDTTEGLPDGILGFSFLKSQPFMLDYINKQLHFSFDEINFDEVKTATIPFVKDRHFITVNTTINDSVKSKMIFDTGASLTFFSQALAKLVGAEDSIFFATISLDNKVTTTGVATKIKDISSLSRVLQTPKVNGILGTSFLVQRKILIDYEHNRLIYIAN